MLFKLHLLADQVHILRVLEILVQFDDVRVILSTDIGSENSEDLIESVEE